MKGMDYSNVTALLRRINQSSLRSEKSGHRADITGRQWQGSNGI